MKTQNRLFGILILLLVLTLGCTACSKDEPIPPPLEDGELPNDKPIVETVGVSADAFETYLGDVGFVLDTRELVKKGYVPTQAIVTVEATHGNYSQTIEIDPISFMGQIKIPLEELSEAAIAELNSGVNLSSDIKDANGSTIIFDPVATVSFQSNPNAKTVLAHTLEETAENATIKLNEGTFYYFQPINADGNPIPGKSMGARGPEQDNVLTVGSGAEFNGNEPGRNFSFLPIPGKVNTFAIRIRSGGRFIAINNRLEQTTPSPAQALVYHAGPAVSNADNFLAVQNDAIFHFKIKKMDTGIYELQTHEGTPIRVAAGVGLTIDEVLPTYFGFGGNDDIISAPITWRLISTSVDWQVQNVGTTYLEPILSAAQTDFKFNSTLTNCGQGSLSQTVGSAITETRTRTVGFEESLSMMTTEEVGISATVGVDIDAKFFGAGATYNASVTAEYKHSRSVTESSTTFKEINDTKNETIFAERTVTVPSGSASLVYDVFQFYEDTKVNFVQRLRISGVDSETGMSLTGDEIRSQFQFSSFDGVIAAIEPTSVVITLRGTTVLDKIVKTESDVQDVASNCGG